MQGHRSAIGSLAEALDFEHGSSSSNPVIDQQMCWSSMRNSGEHGLPDFILPPGDAGNTCLNSVGHEGQNVSIWNLGEPSSRQNEANHDERKAEYGWSSSLNASTVLGPRLEERQQEPNSIFSWNNDNVNIRTNQILNGPLFMQSSTADVGPPNLNLNAGFVGHVDDDCQIMECPNPYKSSGSMNGRITSANCSSVPFGVSSGSGGYLVEESDGRPGGSLEGGRLSCKRKAIEGNAGQSSVSGSSRRFKRAESIGWQAVPSHPIAGKNLSINSPSENISGPSPLEHVNPRLGLGLRAVASGSHPNSSMAGCAENSQRNLPVRISPPSQDSVPLNFVPTGSAYRNFNVSSAQQSSRILPDNHPLDLSSAPLADNTHPQSQPAVIHVSDLPQNVPSLRWNGDSSSRLGATTSSIIPGGRIAAPHEEGSLRNMSRHIMEHPLFVPATELRNLAQNPTSRILTGGSTSIPRNVASTSRSRASSGVHPPSAPTWVPHRNSSQYPQRLSEYVRRSLISSVGSDSGGPNGSHSPIHSGASASSQEAVLSSGANNQGNHQTYRRSALWMGRQGDGALGAPYSLRTLAAASEGRSRLVSEIRNVLDLMRRGEGLRLEDVMILDQSLLFGVADVHDRHRDMRLDVDNMSYEELLALGERIGDVSTGLSEETILNRLKQQKYVSIAIEAQSEAEPCSICREEYNDGEDLGVLECGHDFHTGCVKQWLKMKNLCPICKTTALVT